jgi:hypothetical protein
MYELRNQTPQEDSKHIILYYIMKFLQLTCICVDMTCTAIGSVLKLCPKLDNPSDRDPINFDE